MILDMKISKTPSSKTIRFGEMLLWTFLTQGPTQYNEIGSGVKLVELLFFKSV